MISINSQKNTSFCGLKANIEESRIIVANLRKELNFPNSNQHLIRRLCKTNFPHEKQHLFFRLNDLKVKYSNKLGDLRNELCRLFHLKKIEHIYLENKAFVHKVPEINYHEFADRLKFLVQYFGVANCAEHSILTQYEHFKRGIPIQNLCLAILQKGTSNVLRAHETCVRGINRNYDINTPATWGQNAILVDNWGNICEKALNTSVPTYINGKIIEKDTLEGGLTKILNFMGFDKDREKLYIMNSNTYFADAYIEHMLKVKQTSVPEVRAKKRKPVKAFS